MTDIALGRWKMRNGQPATVDRIIDLHSEGKKMRVASGTDQFGNQVSWHAATGAHAFGGYVAPGSEAMDLTDRA